MGNSRNPGGAGPPAPAADLRMTGQRSVSATEGQASAAQLGRPRPPRAGIIANLIYLLTALLLVGLPAGWVPAKVDAAAWTSGNAPGIPSYRGLPIGGALGTLGLLLLQQAKYVAAWPQGLPNGVSVRSMVQGFQGWITDMAFITQRHVLVSTKDGRVYLLTDWTFSRAQPLLDMRSRVKPAVGDRGLVSLAVHPDFQKNGRKGYVYVAWVDDPAPNCQALGQMCMIKYNKIKRLLLEYNDRTRTFEIKDDRIVWGMCTPRLMREGWWGDDCSPMVGTTHSIGGMWFGSDGKLWVSVGEGQLLEGDFWNIYWKNIAGDYRALSMDPDFLGGKILRMEANHPDGILRGLPDNPFYSGNDRSARSMVWAVGLRNPWRCSHNPPNTTREVICGVVGYYSYESVIRARRGSNLGWPCWEGVTRTPGGGADKPICQQIYSSGAESAGYPGVNLNQVMYVYNHDGTSAASIGGVILPSYWPAGWAGRFIFTDYARSTIWAISPNDNSVWTVAQGGDNIVSFKVSPFDGYVYMVLMCRGCSYIGHVRRFEVRGYRPPVVKLMTTSKRRTTTRRRLITTKKGTRPGKPTSTATMPTCTPTTGPQLDPLPVEADGQAWDTIMFLTKGGFPDSRITTYANGGWGPVGWDSSIGPGPGQTMNKSTVISIGGEYYTQGIGTKGTSVVGLDFTGKNKCYKFTAMVGIDDEIHVNGTNQTAWADFSVKSGVKDGAKSLYSSTTALKARGLAPIKARDPALQVTVTNLHLVSSLLLVADRPGPLSLYSFNFANAHYDWATAKLYCGPDAPYMPTVMITTPLGPTERTIGDVVPFAGRAFYYDGTEIKDPNAFQWNVVLVHCQGYLCHQHSEVDGMSGFSGSFTVNDHATGVAQYYFYQINLVVTDGCGRSDRAMKTVLVKGFSRRVTF